VDPCGVLASRFSERANTGISTLGKDEPKILLGPSRTKQPRSRRLQGKVEASESSVLPKRARKRTVSTHAMSIGTGARGACVVASGLENGSDTRAGTARIAQVDIASMFSRRDRVNRGAQLGEK